MALMRENRSVPEHLTFRTAGRFTPRLSVYRDSDIRVEHHYTWRLK